MPEDEAESRPREAGVPVQFLDKDPGSSLRESRRASKREIFDVFDERRDDLHNHVLGGSTGEETLHDLGNHLSSECNGEHPSD